MQRAVTRWTSYASSVQSTPMSMHGGLCVLDRSPELAAAPTKLPQNLESVLAQQQRQIEHLNIELSAAANVMQDTHTLDLEATALLQGLAQEALCRDRLMGHSDERSGLLQVEKLVAQAVLLQGRVIYRIYIDICIIYIQGWTASQLSKCSACIRIWIVHLYLMDL